MTLPALALPVRSLFRPLLTASAILAGTTVFAQPIDSSEASALLKRATEQLNAPGSYRTHFVGRTDRGTTTTTTLTSNAPGRPSYSRVETVTVLKGPPEKTYSRLTIRNAEGRWVFFGNKAVLVQQPFERASPNTVLQKALTLDPKEQPIDDASKRLVAQAAEIARHIRIEGERFEDKGRPLVRVTRTMDEQSRKILEQIMNEEISTLKKQLSLPKRILVSTMLATKGGIGKTLPTREVFIIDPADHRIVSTETFTADGKSRVRRTLVPEKIADLPPETFSLPKDAELIRPRSFEESIEITEKLEKERKKAEAAQT